MVVYYDFLRAIVTDVMLVLLLCTMVKPKYQNKIVYIIASVIVVALNLLLNLFFYIDGNYTAVFVADIAFLITLGICFKPLFKDTVFQWYFSYITMLNMYGAVVFLSYMLSDFFKNSYLGVIILRFIMFSVIIFLFKRFVAPLYKLVLENWNIYILPVISILLCFLAYFAGDDILQMLEANYIYLTLLIVLCFTVYISILSSLKNGSNQYKIRDENRQMQTEREFLTLASNNMAQRITLMEEMANQAKQTEHDRRHFNNLLLELLQTNNTEKAISLLTSGFTSSVKTSKIYCENIFINATITHYIKIAEEANINVETSLDIKPNLQVDSLELSMVIANLLENSIKAFYKSLPNPQIKITCRDIGRLLLEVRNTCNETVLFDENHLPITNEENHGVGTKSVVGFVKKYNGEIAYKQENNEFVVRIIV